jgi:hypothetical protein
MRWPTLFAVAVVASLLPAAADAASARKKAVAGKKKIVIVYKFKRVRTSPPGVGFLPGYRTPEQLRRIEHRPRYWTWYGEGPYYFGGPGWYRGRYTGGSFGPCWTDTPIGMMWNCGQ